MAEIMQCYYTKDSRIPFNVQAIGRSYCDWNYFSMRECSDVSSVECILDGTGTVVCNGKTFHPEKGDVFIIQTGFQHCNMTDRHNPWRKLWITVYGYYVNDLMRIYGIDQIVYFPKVDCRDLFEELQSVSREESDYEVVCTRVASILQRLVHRLAVRTKENVPATRQAIAIKEILDRHIEEGISLEELSGQVFLSVSQIIRIFKKNFGVTPYDYILDKKIETAKILLKNSALNIRQISDRLNFSDEHYFSNFFKRKVGVRPKEYVKR